MTDRELLLAAIIANPDEDTPRLMYADEIEGDEPERAEFIRVQCRIDAGGIPDCTYGCPRTDCVRCQLRRRERELFQADDARTLKWFGLPDSWARVVRLSPFDHTRHYPYAIAHRGFIECISCVDSAWLKHADAICAAHPVRKVVLTTFPSIETITNANGTIVHGWRILGREWIHPAMSAVALLEAEWPRIKFEMPSPFVTLEPRTEVPT